MDNKEIKDRLADIKIENFVWIIYIIIIFLSFLANKLEVNYLKTKNINSKNKYRNIMIFIFVILIIVYFNFFKSSYNDLKKLNKSDDTQKKELTFLSFLASFLILLSGIIYLYILIKDENIDIEIAFN